MIKTTFATVVSVMLITNAIKLSDKKNPPAKAGLPASTSFLTVSFLYIVIKKILRAITKKKGS